ncbi:MAG TPA: caspase family protein [Conexibacter sp.]|nr:caspase family protein [Conexibacter sp.]
MAARDHALVVGIDGYSKLRRLQGAEADALAMRDWLVDADGGDVPSAQVTTILSSAYPPAPRPAKARPMTDDVRAELEQLIDDAGPGLRLGRRLYLYLAGHGFAPAIDEVAVLMANASDRTLHHMPCVRYADKFRESTVFEEVVLLIDCCREMYEWPPRGDLGLPSITVQGASVAYFYGFATGWSQMSRESPAPDGSVRGRFTRAVVEALDEPGADSDSVERYVARRMSELDPGGRAGRPEFRRSGTLGFGATTRASAAAAKGGAAVVRFAAATLPVQARIVDNASNVVAKALVATSPWTVPLQWGLYELFVDGGSGPGRAFRVPAAGSVDVDA